MIRLILPIFLTLIIPFAVAAEDISEDDVDLYNGKDVNVVCAACHGELGQGGKNGEYPRLAGQMRSILLRQLRSFRDKHRINIPMIPYTQDRELSEDDMIDVASYLSSLRIYVTIPYVEGDVKAGKKFFKSECGRCHGKEGRGKEKKGDSEKFGPALVGQYPTYLRKQISNFKKGERHNEEMEETAQDLEVADLENILAYLVTVERHPGLSEEVAKETQERFKSVLGSLAETANANAKEKTGDAAK
jgi:cytochrome c553